MDTNRKTKTTATAMVPVQFRAQYELVKEFRKVVEGEERTLSQDLRRYMAERVEAAGRKEAA